MASSFNERTWLEWLVKFRVLVITLVLVIEFAIVSLTQTNVDRHMFVAVILLWYIVSGFDILLAAKWRDVRTQSQFQVLTDLAFATAIIYVTGGIDTSFNFLYPLIIIVASTLLSQTWAYFTAALSFILLGGTLELTSFDYVHSYAITRPDLKSLQAVILINLVAYLAIAYLAGRLANRMRQADTELKDKSSELQDLQVLHELIVNSVSSGLITTDLQGAIKLVNPSARALLEREGWDLQGEQIQTLFLDEIPLAPCSRSEIRALTPNGVEKLFGITASKLHASGPGDIGLIFTFSDLTEIRRLERELRQRDRLAAVGRLAAGIAHEIRNPLSSIAGSVQMLSTMAALTEDQRALVDIVNRESERLNTIITDFLTYSRDKKLETNRVDLRRLLNDTLTLLSHQPSNVKISPNLRVKEAFIEGDENKLKQVFWNLSSNALRAMPERGTLTVTLEGQGNEWLVSFRDTGEGIPSQMMEKIFEPFQSGFHGGTGLGLAIVYRIVHAHNARIAVKSEPGRGTEFTVLFPKSSRSNASTQAAGKSAAS